MKPIQIKTFGFAWAHQAFTGLYKWYASLKQACFFSWAQVRLCSFSFMSLSDATFPSRKVKWLQNQPLILRIGLWGTDHSHEVFIFLGFKKKLPLFPLSWMTVNVTNWHKKIDCPLRGFFLCSRLFYGHALMMTLLQQWVNLNVLTILSIGECPILHNSQPVSQLPSLRPEHHHYPTIDEPLPPSKL